MTEETARYTPTMYEVEFNKIFGRPDPHYFAIPAEDEFRARDRLVRQYAFAIPCEEAVTEIAKRSPILEVGAGNAYWAFELKNRGVDIVATDISELAGNTYEFKSAFEKAPYTELEVIDGVSAVKKYPGHTLMMIWPCYNKPWAFETLKAYEGYYFIYIGEGWGGCTGDQDFHDLLNEKWHQVKSVCLPQWPGIHDWFEVYRRKSPSEIEEDKY